MGAGKRWQGEAHSTWLLSALLWARAPPGAHKGQGCYLPHPHPRPYPWVYTRPVQALARCCLVVMVRPGRDLVACGDFSFGWGMRWARPTAFSLAHSTSLRPHHPSGPPHLDSCFFQELPNPLFAPENHRHPPVKGPSTAALGPQHTTPPQCHLSCPWLWDHQLTPLLR